MPTFTFDVWLSGLVGLVLLLASLGPSVRRGRVALGLASWASGAIMLLNGVGHLAGSVYSPSMAARNHVGSAVARGERAPWAGHVDESAFTQDQQRNGRMT